MRKVFVIMINIAYIFVSFYNDFHFFSFKNEFNSNSVIIYVILKILWLALFISFEFHFFSFIREKITKKEMGIFLLFLVVYLVVFMMDFPGNWGAVGDDLLVYWAAKNLWVWPQQGYAAGIIMILELMVWPKVWMPILINVGLYTGLFTYVCNKLEYKGKRIAKIGVIVLSMSLPVLYYMMTSIRSSVWAITTIWVCFCLFWEEKLEKHKMGIMTIACILVASLRTEGLLIFIMFVMYMVVKKMCNKKAITKLVIITVMTTVLLSATVRYYGGDAYRYRSLGLVSYVCPLSRILSDENANFTSEQLKYIDEVFPIEHIIEAPNDTNFWSGKHWIDEYADCSSKQARRFSLTSWQIFVENISLFIDSRWKMMVSSIPDGRAIGEARSIDMIKYWGINNHKTSGELWKDFEKMSPIRKGMGCVLSGFIPILSVIMYNWWIPIGICFFTFFWVMIRRKRDTLLVSIPIAIVVINFMMIPNAHNMYYFVVYLFGWGELILLIQLIWGRCSENQC